MDKNTKDQYDFADFFGAITILKVMIDSTDKNTNVNVPGSNLIGKWFRELYNDKMGESMVHYQNLMESLKEKLKEMSEDD